MFRLIHRIVVLGCWGLLLAGGWYLFERRALFQPLIDEVEILKDLQLNSDPARVIGQFSGEVFQVTSPDSFRIKTSDRGIYHLRFEAVQAPREKTFQGGGHRKEGVAGLSRLILSNQVHVDLIYTNEYRLGLGMVFRGETNINLQMVKLGLARINPDQLKTLPVKEQHAFLSAQKQAQEEKVGIWK